MTSQLLLYCVRISLSTCYDWPTNQLLLLTVSAVCINQSVVSYCQRGSVLREKTSARQGSKERALYGRQVQCSGTKFVPGSHPVCPRPDSLCSSLFFLNFYKYVQKGHDCLLQNKQCGQYSKFYSRVIWRFISSAAQNVSLLS